MVLSPEILVSYKNATISAKDWGKAWHSWALFNTEVMSRYTLRGRPDIAGKYVVAAVTGYFHSISRASTTKGVDDSLQVNLLFSIFYVLKSGLLSKGTPSRYVHMTFQTGGCHVGHPSTYQESKQPKRSTNILIVLISYFE